MEETKTVDIYYFTDVLCIWAYITETRLQKVQEILADKVTIQQKFISIFGSVASKKRELGPIMRVWKDMANMSKK